MRVFGAVMEWGGAGMRQSRRDGRAGQRRADESAGSLSSLSSSESWGICMEGNNCWTSRREIRQITTMPTPLKLSFPVFFSLDANIVGTSAPCAFNRTIVRTGWPAQGTKTYASAVKEQRRIG